jgi:hypothetical protein
MAHRSFRQTRSVVSCLMQRVLNNRYAERDVKDVEGYVRDTVRGMSDLAPGRHEGLVVRGIFLVRRIAMALPPEASLQEALRDHFAEGLTALCEESGQGAVPPGTPSRRAA